LVRGTEPVVAEIGSVEGTEPVAAEIGSVEETESAAEVDLVEEIDAFEVPMSPSLRTWEAKFPNFNTPEGRRPVVQFGGKWSAFTKIRSLVFAAK
jgi:purine nucleoside permease